MTPEELDRTIEFIVRQQAQFSADLQRDHDVMNQGITELQKTTKKLGRVQLEMAANHRRIAELIEIQAERLDRQDEELRGYKKWQRQFQKEARERHEEALERLDRILDKLTGKNSKPN